MAFIVSGSAGKGLEVPELTILNLSPERRESGWRDTPKRAAESLPILVSSTRKPISYINLAKRFLQEHGEVQLSALGIAVAPMVTVAEILKNRRLAVERKITTSLEALSDDYRVRQKPKMEIVLTKSAEFNAIVAEENEPNAADFGEYYEDRANDNERQVTYTD